MDRLTRPRTFSLGYGPFNKAKGDLAGLWAFLQGHWRSRWPMGRLTRPWAISLWMLQLLYGLFLFPAPPNGSFSLPAPPYDQFSFPAPLFGLFLFPVPPYSLFSFPAPPYGPFSLPAQLYSLFLFPAHCPVDFSCCSHVCSSLLYLWAVLDSLTCGGDSSGLHGPFFVS